MRAFSKSLVFGLTGLSLAGCATPPRPPAPAIRANSGGIASPVVQAGYFAAGTDPREGPPTPKKLGNGPPAPPPANVTGLGLQDLVSLTVERHPRLAQVAWAVETARGRALQAGLYPNPTLNVSGDELGDRTGPGGIWTAPYFAQEIVTGNKLGLSKAAALKEVDQATLTLISERYRLFTEVRQNYWEVVTLQRRAEVLGELIGLSEKSVENANKLLKAKEGSGLDVDLERLRVYVLGVHPEVRSAQVGVERAQLVLRRAAVEPIPNVTLGTGYVRQDQNRSDDWVIAASIPVPVFNRNQGNIFAARGQLGEAVNAVGRAQNDLVSRLASSFATFAAAQKRAETYKAAILPRAEQSYQLSLKAYQGGQFEYLRVLQAQRAVAEARLEYLRPLARRDVAGGQRDRGPDA